MSIMALVKVGKRSEMVKNVRLMSVCMGNSQLE